MEVEANGRKGAAGPPKEQVFGVLYYAWDGQSMGVVATLVEHVDATHIEEVVLFAKRLDTGDQTPPAGLDERQRKAVKDFHDDAVTKVERLQEDMSPKHNGFTFLI